MAETWTKAELKEVSRVLQERLDALLPPAPETKECADWIGAFSTLEKHGVMEVDIGIRLGDDGTAVLWSWDFLTKEQEASLDRDSKEELTYFLGNIAGGVFTSPAANELNFGGAFEDYVIAAISPDPDLRPDFVWFQIHATSGRATIDDLSKSRRRR